MPDPAGDPPRLRASKGLYVIRLKNCAFYANHGVFDEEKALGQRFYVDVELRVNALQGLENDDIGSTIDYGAVFASIEQIVSGQRRFLIEALALDIAKALCRRFDQVEDRQCGDPKAERSYPRRARPCGSGSPLALGVTGPRGAGRRRLSQIGSPMSRSFY